MRLFLAMAIFLPAGAAAFAQPAPTFSRAIAPSNEALERLDLKADWSFYAPVSGQSDGLAKVQILDEFQIAVQTKAGLLCLVDQSTGRLLWKYKYPAKFSSGFGVAVNEKFLFALNVAKLYCFHRYTGVMEFEFDLPEAPSTGPVADGSQVYISSTGAKVLAFQLPPSIRQNPDAGNKKPGVVPDNSKLRNPADVIADRFATRVNPKSANDDEFDRRIAPKSYFESGQSLSTNQRSPSISTLSSVVPPYTTQGLNKVESLSMLQSMRQPYKLHPDHLVYNQYSPSIAVLPPSVAHAYELSNLRPQGVKPQLAWTIGTKQKIAYDPILVASKSQITSPRVWITESSANFLSVSQSTGGTEVSGTFGSEPAGPLVGPFAYGKESLLGFVALSDGQVMAIDLTGGSSGLPRYEWKANVGGFLNHTPIAAADGVYVSGDHSGVAKIDAVSGDVTWRTEPDADRIIAANAEFVYVLNRRGELLVYAKDRVHDTNSKKAKPLTSLGVADFNVPITNATSDRVLLGADNGLIVCLRAGGAKHAKPSRIAPLEKLPVPVKPDVKPGEPAPVPAPKN